VKRGRKGRREREKRTVISSTRVASLLLGGRAVSGDVTGLTYKNRVDKEGRSAWARARKKREREGKRERKTHHIRSKLGELLPGILLLLLRTGERCRQQRCVPVLHSLFDSRKR